MKFDDDPKSKPERINIDIGKIINELADELQESCMNNAGKPYAD